MQKLICRNSNISSEDSLLYGKSLFPNTLVYFVFRCVNNAHLILYCPNVQSHQWLPSEVMFCVCCCAPAGQLGWNAANLATTHNRRYSQYTPWQNWVKYVCLRSFWWACFFTICLSTCITMKSKYWWSFQACLLCGHVNALFDIYPFCRSGV